MARGILTANPGFANYFSVIVDETQDMNEQALKLLAALAKHTPESEPAIFMVGDATKEFMLVRSPWCLRN